MEKIKVGIISLLFVAALNSSALALARYECKGITSDTIVLAPYTNGTVALSFNKDSVAATANFFHKGDVFAAEFSDLDGAADSRYIVILDTITKTGYEYFRKTSRSAAAGKITCWWYQN